jgi:hypothetical protein
MFGIKAFFITTISDCTKSLKSALIFFACIDLESVSIIFNWIYDKTLPLLGTETYCSKIQLKIIETDSKSIQAKKMSADFSDFVQSLIVVIKTSCLPMVGGFLRVPPPLKLVVMI